MTINFVASYMYGMQVATIRFAKKGHPKLITSWKSKNSHIQLQIPDSRRIHYLTNDQVIHMFTSLAMSLAIILL